jgi:hypothetical protein
MDVSISNTNWPDLLEKTERILLIIAGLVLEALFPGENILWYTLLPIALLVHITAIQRFFRGRIIIKAYEYS